MIVIVTGGRNYAGTGLVEALDALNAECPDFELFVGCATGADQIARDWTERAFDAMRRFHSRSVFHADWKRLGKAAGPERNARMVNAAQRERRGRRVVCLAAPGDIGTADCVRRCRKAGFEVRKVTT